MAPRRAFRARWRARVAGAASGGSRRHVAHEVVQASLAVHGRPAPCVEPHLLVPIAQLLLGDAVAVIRRQRGRQPLGSTRVALGDGHDAGCDQRGTYLVGGSLGTRNIRMLLLNEIRQLQEAVPQPLLGAVVLHGQQESQQPQLGVAVDGEQTPQDGLRQVHQRGELRVGATQEHHLHPGLVGAQVRPGEAEDGSHVASGAEGHEVRALLQGRDAGVARRQAQAN
mmetsp:Transcript_99896/g.287043  ORF Transcript_99896/g.287043 Transcript_99896/m.287043 type:complete len:225 (-) Transcript_99896:198-872(-)